MHEALPKSIAELIDHFCRLPGIGPKTATRLVFFLLKTPRETRESFGKSLQDLGKSLFHCSECFHFSETEKCEICKNPMRDQRTLCIVESALDLLAIERTHSYKGRYFVLGGVLSPLEGIGPNNLRIHELKIFLEKNAIEEIIFALPSSFEGESTTTYLSRTLDSFSGSISKIARGIPLGGEIQYADENTLSKAMEERRNFSHKPNAPRN
jgi:recombination protein RecR